MHGLPPSMFGSNESRHPSKVAALHDWPHLTHSSLAFKEIKRSGLSQSFRNENYSEECQLGRGKPDGCLNSVVVDLNTGREGWMEGSG